MVHRHFNRSSSWGNGSRTACAAAKNVHCCAPPNSFRQDRVEKAGPLGKSSDAANPHLSSLQELLSEARQGQYADDPFLMYLHGVVLMERYGRMGRQGHRVA